MPGSVVSLTTASPLLPYMQSGALVYAQRVPERWFPGKFDLFFHSHQIFHVGRHKGLCW